jgi:hypothetical protein
MGQRHDQYTTIAQLKPAQMVRACQLPSEVLWSNYGQSAPYCLSTSTGVAMPLRCAGFGN